MYVVWAYSSVVERCPDKTEVVSSILTTPTQHTFFLTAVYKTEVEGEKRILGALQGRSATARGGVASFASKRKLVSDSFHAHNNNTEKHPKGCFSDTNYFSSP